MEIQIINKFKTCPLITPTWVVYKAHSNPSLAVERKHDLPTNVCGGARRTTFTSNDATSHLPSTRPPADMGDITRAVGRSGRRAKPKAQDSLTALICQKLRESGQDDEFLQSVMAALHDLGEELRRCPSRKASVKLVRRTLSRALAEGRRDQDAAGGAQDHQGARPEGLVAAVGQLLQEELQGEELEGRDLEPEEAKEEEAQRVNEAEDGLECGEDVPDHRGTTGPRPRKDDQDNTSGGQQLKEDSNDALPPMIISENKMIDDTGGNPQEATLHGVQIERLFPQRRNSLSHFYGEEDREITSVRLVMERNKCALYKLEGEVHTKLGVFHADHLKKLKNGFKVTLETQMTSDDVDGGRRPKKKTKRQREASSVILTVPQEQQEECMNLLSRMRKTLPGILFGSSGF
ncbi:hypothetical protein C7M84_022396 [Penaeus vannamei]|uniref:Uncharacterized protein n=1 Tax=Penaeus vannamei TaxID=6689 RepID=A0A3R7MJK1_PENVA|nr:hypothetical protein C7M84_022396 [Penaeus vannamei]